ESPSRPKVLLCGGGTCGALRPRMHLRGLFAILLTGLLACSGEAPSEDEATDASELSGPGNAPLACADPTVFSTRDQGNTNFVFCTGMGHVWKTSDWKAFTNERASLTFDFGAMADKSKVTAHWSAPTVVYDKAHDRYVMWVSVIDGQDFKDDTRSLAVFHAPDPLGPWKFVALGDNASVNGEMLIDPMIFRDHDGTHYLYWKRYGGGLSS